MIFLFLSCVAALEPLTKSRLLEISKLESSNLPLKTQAQLEALRKVGDDIYFSQALTFNLENRLNQMKSSPAALNPSVTSPDFLASARREYLENDHLIYVDNFFTKEAFDAIIAETRRLWASGAKEIEPNCNLDGRDRIGGFVQVTFEPSNLYSLIYANEELFDFVSEISSGGTRSFFPADFPIELREYGPKSRGMQCHSDLQMYADPEGDLEIVITLTHEEASQSQVRWFDKLEEEHNVRTEANSITIVKPNAAVHCVTGTKGGSREILKFILVSGYVKPGEFYQYASNACDTTLGENRRAIDRRASSDEL